MSYRSIAIDVMPTPALHVRGRGSRVVKLIASRVACHEFKSSIAEDPHVEGADARRGGSRAGQIGPLPWAANFKGGIQIEFGKKNIVRVQYFVRGGSVGHRSRASSKHLSPHLPVDELDSSGGQTGVALHLQMHVWVSGPQRKPTRC
ncbi:hypothetical protein TNCV_5136541 [Trichonephila clavipes]|nr:hypothetical protein TNCV_5136541 [Trichonephila clavipes]